MSPRANLRGVAIIGIALRLPGALTSPEFWRNLRDGVESITFFSDQELLAAGIDPAALTNPDYVKASPIVEDFDRFDADFFSYSPKEAAIMDPQNRLFLQTCWEALEDAGYDPERTGDAVVGVFAGGGSALTSYMLAYSGHPEMQGQTAGLQHVNTDRDFLSTRVSYKLNLTGPSLTVQTACSTSLVAVHLACQALQHGECDMALAGASTIRVPHISGYFAVPGSVQSSDGHCRAFDAAGRGTIFGSGVAAVVLKDLESAVDDGNHVYAVIKGSAVNNDGAAKISYTAASAKGQARAILEALEVAEISADTIGYVECHATGTAAGDPIEIQALTRAFRAHTSRRRFCAVGSVKANIGHPEQSAGMAGLIKTALALHHGQRPPSLHFVAPNPSISFDETPFYVQTELAAWPRESTPRRAAVNSLGIGGTNAFVVLEEAPDADRRASSEPASTQVCCLSAKTDRALRRRADQFLAMLASGSAPPLEDLCYTANVSRSRLPRRFSAVASTSEELQEKLSRFLASPTVPRHADVQPGGIAFLFSGQGAQYPGMSAELYRTLPTFRQALDECGALLSPHLRPSLDEILFAPESNSVRLSETRVAQPALFAVEYALAQVWQSWGITPSAVMGHSIGELVAACVAGVFNLREAIELVSARAALMQDLAERGGMEAFFTDEQTIRQALLAIPGRLGIAAFNGPRNVVVSGESEAIDRLRAALHSEGVSSKRLTVSHAFHSALLDAALPGLERAAGRLDSKPPRLPLVSNLTGTLVCDAPAPAYWCAHARQPVRFADGMETLHALGCSTFLETGPGTAAIASGRECLAGPNFRWLASIARNRSDLRTMLESLRQLYLDGAQVNWRNVHETGPRRRVSLPTYPFERTRFWLEPAQPAAAPSTVAHPVLSATASPILSEEERETRDAFYRVSWLEQTPSGQTRPEASGAWLIFADEGGLGAALASTLEQDGVPAHTVRAGSRFESPSPRQWTINSARPEDAVRLLRAVAQSEPRPVDAIAYLWGLDAPSAATMTTRGLVAAEARTAKGALHLARALVNGNHHGQSRLWFVTRGAQSVPRSGEATEPIQALLWGLGRTLALEAPGQCGGAIDLFPDGRSGVDDLKQLIGAIRGLEGESEIAIRQGRRYVSRLERRGSLESAGPPPVVRPDATYLIAGGFGMLGLTIAKWLVESAGARHLVLVGRRGHTAESRSAISALEARGVTLRLVSADLSHEADVRRVMRETRRDLPPLRGVVHSAGVLADGILGHVNWEAFTRVTAPKVRGAWLLHHHTQRDELDFFLVYSSLLSLTGSAGQASYTAANAFLDSLVDYRRSCGLPAMGINWGPWGGSGMAATAGPRGEALWRRRGISLVGLSLAWRVLDALFARPVDHAVVVTCDWSRYVQQRSTPSRFFERVVVPSRPEDPGTPEAEGGDLLALLRGARPDERRQLLVTALGHQLMKELGFDRGVDVRQPLEQLGVDSLMAVNLVSRLESSLGIRLPVVKLIRSPSLEGLADELLPELVPSSPLDPTAAEAHRPQGAGPVVSVTRGDGWLVFPKPNAAARSRLFCFNYAGGGAATYRPWADLLAPSIELVAIEPPGRASRIDEAPFVRMEALLESLMPVMSPYLDKPTAFFGHCLGALSLFEMARHLLRGDDAPLVHVFVSGSRPPHSLNALGPFEERLLALLTADPSFDPLSEFHEQPEEIFATIIRRFDIGVTDEFLSRPELRNLLLPAIRADFELATRYRFTPEPPWDMPITCFSGLDDTYVTREDALGWSRYTQREFRIHFRKGSHFLVAEDRAFIVAAINHTLTSMEPVGNPVSRTVTRR